VADCKMTTVGIPKPLFEVKENVDEIGDSNRHSSQQVLAAG